jgi:transcriptional regulator with XRE-family HTH domain
MSAGNDIGGRLRHERQARGMSLRKVAKDLGVSASLISQVETGKTQPSVATLYALASLMSISVDVLLGLPTEQSASSIRDLPQVDLQRGADNPVIEMENGVRWERLAMGRGGVVDALLVTYQPGASSSLEGKLMRHAGSEYAYMLDGEITLQLEFDSYVLARGDSVHFDSSRPHMFSNQGSVPATGIWFVVGRRDNVAAPRGNRGFSQAPSARSALDVLARLDSLD